MDFFFGLNLSNFPKLELPSDGLFCPLSSSELVDSALLVSDAVDCELDSELLVVKLSDFDELELLELLIDFLRDRMLVDLLKRWLPDVCPPSHDVTLDTESSCFPPILPRFDILLLRLSVPAR